MLDANRVRCDNHQVHAEAQTPIEKLYSAFHLFKTLNLITQLQHLHIKIALVS